MMKFLTKTETLKSKIEDLDKIQGMEKFYKIWYVFPLLATLEKC